MARKKIANLVGTDPEYSKTFDTAPKAEQKAAAPDIAADAPDTGPAPENDATTGNASDVPQHAEARGEPQSTPKEAAKAKEPKPKPAKRASAPRPTRQKPTQERAPAKPEKAVTRVVHVRASPKAEHKSGLDALDAAGVPAADVVRLAGQRALAKFELSGEYRPKDKAARLPTELSYRTMKTLDATRLDRLRDLADPLRLRSDAFVIQGQLEPVFWAELDVVIAELRDRFPN